MDALTTVYVVRNIFDAVFGVYSDPDTARAAAEAAGLKNDEDYSVECHVIDQSGPEEWAAACEREASMKSERKRKEQLMDDVETLQTACSEVPRLQAFEMPADRDALDDAWAVYDAKQNDVRSRVREAAKKAGVYNYAAELVVVSDKLGHGEFTTED